MFEFVRTHKRLMHILLLLFIVPSFAFFGLESYTRFRDRDKGVASVAGQTISRQEFENAQRSQMERFRQLLGDQFDPKMFDTPEARKEILDGLITQRVMAAEVQRNGLTVSERTLQQTILEVPGLTDANGKFDVERYKSLLAAQGLTPEMYEAQLRRDLVVQQLSNAVQATAFAPKTVATRLSELAEQQREVQQALFKTSDYLPKVEVTDAMLKDYYEKNGKLFDVPEHIKAEYVVLDGDAIAAQIKLSDADLRAYYEQNKQRYAGDEQRRARHILIAVDSNASPEQKAAAKAKAEQLLAQVRKNPDQFAAIARANSQDPGSAERGGDLDFFGRGMMVKAFEDAAFRLKEGEISDVVESEFGYHIIQLTAIKPAEGRSFEQVKNEIAAEIKKQQAARKYAELAETFSNTVYEQSDSLQPVAQKMGLTVQSVSGLTKTPNPALGPAAPYNQPKFLATLFSDEAIKEKRNTEAVEVAPNTLIAGRVVEYQPVTRKPFDEVKAIVRERVTQEEAAKLARKAGEAKLAAAREAGDASGFGAPVTVSRNKAEGIPGPALSAVMKADVNKLPSYVGADLGAAGYGVYRINKVSQSEKVDPARRAAEQQQIGNLLAQQEMAAYIEGLKKKAKVNIHASALQAPAQGQNGE